MADPDEENKVRNIDSPEDLSGESGNGQPVSVLCDIRIQPQEDEGSQDGNRDVKTLSGLPHVFKENGILSNDLMSFIHHLLFLLDPSVAFYFIGRKKL